MFSILTGGLTDFSWPDESTTVTGSDGSSYETSLSLFGDSCVGHRGSDVFPFGITNDDDPGFQIRTQIKSQPAGNTLTNRELLEALDPRENKMSYIYDNFMWPHCAKDGYDFNEAWRLSEADSDGARKASSNTVPVLFKVGTDRLPRYSFLMEVQEEMASRRASS